MQGEFTQLEKPFRYRPDVDGLRAVAVLPVILFHAGLGLPGGYVGVDIFFVISGFLITSLISREMLKGEFSFKQFWERRLRRIFPMAVLVTLVTIVVGYWTLMPDALAAQGKAGLAQITMVANFYFWQQDGYFAGPSDMEPLLHMWSLGVEEQYYLLFPWLLFALMKRGEKRTRTILLVLFAASLLWSFYGVHFHKKATFYLLPARWWELLLGSFLALLPLPALRKEWTRQACAILGLGLIAFAVWSYDLATPFPGLAALPPCLGAILCIYANGQGTTLVGRLLSLPPVVFVGKISYSLYLWHWPLLVYARHLSVHEVSTTTRVLLVAASFILAILSWWLVETPFRKKTIWKSRREIFRYSAAITAILAVAFTALYKLDGLPSRLRGADAALAEVEIQKPSARILNGEFDEFPLLLPDSKIAPSPFLIWGDSHARAMVAVFQQLGEERGLNGYHAVRPSTPPLLGVNCLPDDDLLAPHNDRVFKAIEKHGIKKVFLIAKWAYYFERGRHSQLAPLSDRDTTGRPQETVFRESLNRTVNALRDRGIEVVILQQVPLQDRSIPAALWVAGRFGYALDQIGVTLAEHHAYQDPVNNILHAMAGDGVEVLDPTPLLSLANGRTKVKEGEMILYTDYSHLSNDGAHLLAPLLAPHLPSPAESP